MDAPHAPVASRLRQVRRDLYQDDPGRIAADLGLSPGEWRSLEAGERPPGPVLPRLVDRTGLSVRWLVLGCGPRRLGRHE